MSLSRKYAFVLASASAVAVIYAYVPLTRDDIAKPRWFDHINVTVNKSLALAKPQALSDEMPAVPGHAKVRL